MTGPHPAVDRARALFAAGRRVEAEQTLLSSLDPEHRDLAILKALVSLYLETNRLPESARVLSRVIELEPADPEGYQTLAVVLNRLGRVADLTRVYERMVANRPDDALAHFNLACCLRRDGRLEEALAMHERAIALGVERAEDAWTNVGVIHGELHRNADARAAFETALSLNPRWIPALYNLGLWHEEHGDRTAAVEAFERILVIDPDHPLALARLAYARRIEDAADPLIGRLNQALGRRGLAPTAHEGLHFALGKALDDCGRYDEAFAQYRAGNDEARARARPYDPATTGKFFAAVRAAFTSDWLERCTPVSDAAPVFICGMFRSGSTLLEQMLAVHPRITAGGEIAYFQARIPWLDASWPEQLARAAGDELRTLGSGYLEYLARTFPGAGIVTDKRPDNFLLLGLLRGLFPNARFLHTVRDLRDTALSIYFQQLGDAFSYAHGLDAIAHYLSEYRALMDHWKRLLGESLLDVRYESLVDDPAGELRRVCRFLGVDWSEDMSNFHQGSSRVRTASVWQVREPLYASSIGRWRHYAAHLGALATLAGEEATHDQR